MKGVNKGEYTRAGLVAVMIPNVGWGLSDVCIAIIGRGQVVTWVHGVTGAFFAIGVLVAMRNKLNFRKFLRAFPIGLQRAIVWGALFYAFQEDNPAIGITILSFSLIVSIVVFGPLLGEKVSPQILAIAFVGVVGVILTANTSLTGVEFSKSAIIAIAMLPLAASGTYVLRHVLKSVNPQESTTYMYLWIAILYTPVMFFIDPVFEFTNYEIFIIAVLTIAGTGGHFLFSYSQKYTTFRFNAIASTLHVPATALFSWWLIDATLLPHQIVGMVIVIGVVAYMSIATHPKDDQATAENLVLEA